MWKLKGPKPLQNLACTRCERHKSRAEFYTRSKNGQVIQPCQECAKAIARAKPVPPDIKRRSREKHATKISSSGRRYNQQPENKARRIVLLKQRKSRDPGFAIECTLRRTLADKVRKASTGKAASTMTLLGCSMPDFLAHIERQWVFGMSWSNWGRGSDRWHIDHKKPISLFDLTVAEDQRACFHYSNMQPMWAVDNMRKGNRFVEGMCGV